MTGMLGESELIGRESLEEAANENTTTTESGLVKSLVDLMGLVNKAQFYLSPLIQTNCSSPHQKEMTEEKRNIF